MTSPLACFLKNLSENCAGQLTYIANYCIACMQVCQPLNINNSEIAIVWMDYHIAI